MKNKSPLFPLILLLLMAGCTSKEVNKKADMRLHDIWAIKSIDGSDYKKDSSDKFHPVIEIYVRDRRVHGTTNCNTLNGELKIEGNKISFINITCTEMACPGNLEKRFLSALEDVNSYKIEKERLILLEGEKIRLIFRKID